MPAAVRSIEPATTDAAPLADPLVAVLSQRGLLTPALLFAAGHRPLAFAAGQLLALVAPMAAVLGLPHMMEWAHALSTPDGVDRLQAALASKASQEHQP